MQLIVLILNKPILYGRAMDVQLLVLILNKPILYGRAMDVQLIVLILNKYFMGTQWMYKLTELLLDKQIIYGSTMDVIIIILIKRCSLTRVKLTALYTRLMTKTTLTYISNKQNFNYCSLPLLPIEQ